MNLYGQKYQQNSIDENTQYSQKVSPKGRKYSQILGSPTRTARAGDDINRLVKAGTEVKWKTGQNFYTRNKSVIQNHTQQRGREQQTGLNMRLQQSDQMTNDLSFMN